MTDQTHLSPREVEDFADELIAKVVHVLPAERRAHLADCLACRNEVIFLYRINLNMQEDPAEVSATAGTLQSLPGIRTPDRLKGGTWWPRMAAAIAIVVGCGAFLAYLALRHNADPAASPQVAVKEGERSSLSTGERDMRLALLRRNSEPSANMEDLISSPFRGASIRIVAPRGGDTLQLPYTLKWERAGTSLLTLRVETNREEERIRSQTRESSFTVQDTLTPGLYYWAIEEDGSLVFAGKFYVK